MKDIASVMTGGIFVLLLSVSAAATRMITVGA